MLLFSHSIKHMLDTIIFVTYKWRNWLTVFCF